MRYLASVTRQARTRVAAVLLLVAALLTGTIAPAGAALLVVDVATGDDVVWGSTDPDATVSVEVRDGATLVADAIVVADGSGDFFVGCEDWFAGSCPDITPGQVLVVDTGALTLTLPIGWVSGEVDATTDHVVGTLHAMGATGTTTLRCILTDRVEWPMVETTTDADGGAFDCDFATAGWDILAGEHVQVVYDAPGGHQVFNPVHWPSVTVDQYAGRIDDGRADAGVPATVVLTDAADAVEATATLTTDLEGRFAVAADQWTPATPDIVPGDRVHVTTPRHNWTVTVGQIDGVMDTAADTVSGTIDQPELADPVTVECWISTSYGLDPGLREVAGVDPDGGAFVCDWSGEYDLRPFDAVWVSYLEADGDRVRDVVFAPGANPTDLDDDGLPDDLERLALTFPYDPDSDDDGLSDGTDPSILVAVVWSLDPSVFVDAGRRGTRNATISRLLAAEELLLAGEVDEAIAQLENLRRRVDGCPPAPDANDWIVDCAAQLLVRQYLDLLIANQVTVVIDPTVAPALDSLLGIAGGPPRPTAAVVAPDGGREEFVEDELIVHAETAQELAALRTTYAATIVHDFAPRLADTATDPEPVPELDGWYLLRITPATSSLDDLQATMAAAGLRGEWTFSSEDAARLFAAAQRERDHGVSPDYIADELPAVNEHPDDSGGYLDFATRWWMTEDDDPTTPAEDGLSVGVVHAWDYVKYQGYPQPDVPYTPVTLAVVDSGFDLDPTTGLPTNLSGGNDYPPGRPAQLDEIAVDWTAGGHGVGYSNCNDDTCWHGQMAFGLAAGISRNDYGGAGTSGGTWVTPLLIKTNADAWLVATAVKNALYNGADVINVNYALDCGWSCSTFQDGNVLAAAVGSATGHGAVVVAPAGNHARDISGAEMIPCELAGAICVGAVEWNDAAHARSNWGSVVDIWGVSGALVTPTRTSVVVDGNAVGEDELATFSGTCAASAYVAGIVSLVRMLGPSLSVAQVRDLLVATANPSPDPKVTGTVDAYRAVAAARPNQSPTVDITAPAPGSTLAYGSVLVSAQVSDPETPTPFWGLVDFTSQLVVTEVGGDGTPLCTASGDVTTPPGGAALGCEVTGLLPGTTTLRATVTDPFGATGSDTVTVTLVNTPPTATITQPPTGSTFTTSQQVNLRGFGFDPDQSLPATSLVWTSSRDDELGTGTSVLTTLSEGIHVITLTVTDERGAIGTDTITLEVVEGAGYPSVMIIQPAEFASFAEDEPITFTALAYDVEDGFLTGTSLAWSSSEDGPLGTGTSITTTLSTTACGVTGHQVTVTATDSDGHTATHTITVLVGTIC